METTTSRQLSIKKTSPRDVGYTAAADRGRKDGGLRNELETRERGRALARKVGAVQFLSLRGKIPASTRSESARQALA